MHYDFESYPYLYKKHITNLVEVWGVHVFTREEFHEFYPEFNTNTTTTAPYLLVLSYSENYAKDTVKIRAIPYSLGHINSKGIKLSVKERAMEDAEEMWRIKIKEGLSYDLNKVVKRNFRCFTHAVPISLTSVKCMKFPMHFQLFNKSLEASIPCVIFKYDNRLCITDDRGVDIYRDEYKVFLKEFTWLPENVGLHCYIHGKVLYISNMYTPNKISFEEGFIPLVHEIGLKCDYSIIKCLTTFKYETKSEFYEALNRMKQNQYIIRHSSFNSLHQCYLVNVN